MPNRALVPVPLTEAQPRVYKAFRGRQLKGLAAAVAGVALVVILMGMREFAGYALAFLAALPGFAYGYYQPQGKPLEYWLRVLLNFYITPQMITAHPVGLRPRWRLLTDRLAMTLMRLRRMGTGKSRAAQINPEPNRPRRRAPGPVKATHSNDGQYHTAPGWAGEERKTGG